MPSTQKLPSGSWRSRIHIGEGRYKSFTAPTKKEAEWKAYLYLTEHPTSARIEQGDATVLQLMERYIESRRNVMSPTTYISYSSMMSNYFYTLKQKKPSQLFKDDVQREVNDMASRLSPKTVRNAYALLKSAVERYAPEAFTGILLPKKFPKEITIPETEDVKAILEHLRGTRYELPFSIAAWCGLRRGEICALTYGDIDTKTGIISVSKSLKTAVGGGYEVKDPKSKTSVRKVFCPKIVADLAKMQGKDHKPSDRIVDVNISMLNDVLHHSAAVLGIRPFRFHDFRHYACSLMISLGYPYAYIKDQLGHSSEKMINQVYGHLMSEKKAELFAGMDKKIKDIMT